MTHTPKWDDETGWDEASMEKVRNREWTLIGRTLVKQPPLPNLAEIMMAPDGDDDFGRLLTQLRGLNLFGKKP